MVLKGKNVLVTGGTGFIGSHLVDRLVAEGVRVIVTYQSTIPNSFFTSSGLGEKVICANCDIKNFKRVFDVTSHYEIDFVFHFAAQAVVPIAFINPLETIETNIIGTANILEACRLRGRVKGIVVVSSDKAYGKIPRASEANFLSGDHPYETSKLAADFLATTYFKTYQLPTVVVRFGNTYGEGDLNFSRIVPGVMKSLIRREPLLVRSNGKNRRDYVYVEDVVGATLMLAKNLKRVAGEAFNISSGENLSVIELIRKIGAVLDVRVNYKILNQSINEVPSQSINFNKIRKALGWTPRQTLTKTLPGIYDWYAAYFAS